MAEAQAQTAQELQDDIALRLWSGDETVIRDILMHYAPSLITCLHGKYKGTLTVEDVEELVADAIRILWNDRAKYDEKRGKVRTLLYRIADCDAKDLIGSGWQQVRRRERTGADELLGQHKAREVPPPSSKPDKQRQRLLKDVREVFEKLPKDQRDILMAKALAPEGEVTSGKLAEELGLPANTVRGYLKRARDTMKREMEGRGHVLSSEGGAQ